MAPVTIGTKGATTGLLQRSTTLGRGRRRTVHNCREMAEVLLHGAHRLTFNRTMLNDRASRSHSIFTIYLTKVPLDILPSIQAITCHCHWAIS